MTNAQITEVQSFDSLTGGALVASLLYPNCEIGGCDESATHVGRSDSNCIVSWVGLCEGHAR